MFKQIDNVTTLGLRCKENGRQMFEYIWEQFYENNLTEYIHEYIYDECIYDDNYKKVDELLIPFIGVYPLECNALNDEWSPLFIDKLARWMYTDISSISSTNRYTTKIDEKSTQHILNKILSVLQLASDFNQGICYYQGRKIKIIKFIKSQLKKCIEISDTKLEQFDWYRYYIMKKETKNKLYLVITNSIASQLGMSSYAPKKENNRVWTSCQTISGHNYGYARCVPSNLTDKGSLICYITDGSDVDFYGIEHKDYTHQTIMYRWMLRLLKSETGDAYLMLDRAYPHDGYASLVIDKLLQLSNENNIPLTLSKGYNSTQNDEKTDYSNIKAGDVIMAKSYHKPMYSTAIDSDGYYDGTYSHYDDQNGLYSSDNNIDDSSHTYWYDYKIKKVIKSPKKHEFKCKFKINDKVMINTFDQPWLPSFLTRRHGYTGIVRAIDNGTYGIELENGKGDCNLYDILDNQNGIWIDHNWLKIIETNKTGEAAA